MSEQVPEERFVLRVEEQVEGVARFLDAIGVVPEALQALSAQINATPIGDLGVFQGKGAQLAQAVVAGYQASLRGALAGISPADFALQSVGGEDLRRALQNQADAAGQYARALQSINEATARARAMGMPELAIPAAPTFAPNVSSRLTEDANRATRFENRVEQVLARFEQQGLAFQAAWNPISGSITGVSTERLALPSDLSPVQEPSRRAADREAVQRNTEVLQALNGRLYEEQRFRGDAGLRVPNAAQRETIIGASELEAALGARNFSMLIRGRELPGGTFDRLTAEQRIALFGSEDAHRVGRGARLAVPGFITPDQAFRELLQQAIPPEMSSRLSLPTAEAAQTDRARFLAEQEQADAQRRAEERRREEREARRRMPEGEQFVTVYRGSDDPLDLGRIGAGGLRVTRDRDYAMEHGGARNLYEMQIAASRFETNALREAQGLGPVPHTFISAAEAARLRASAPPLRREVSVTEGGDPSAIVRRLRGAGLGDEDVLSALGNLGFKQRDARALVESTQGAAEPVNRLARVIDRLGDEASETASEVQRTAAFVAGPRGIRAVGDGDLLPVPTGETLAEARLRLARSQQAFEGVFPRADITAERQFLAQMQARLRGGGPLALTAGAGSAPLIPFAGSFFPGGPNGPFSPLGGGFGPGGFGQNPFDWEDLDERARERARNRRFAREAFQDTGPGADEAFAEEARRRQEQRDRQRAQEEARQRAGFRAEREAYREARNRDILDDDVPFRDRIRAEFLGGSGSFRTEARKGFFGIRDGEPLSFTAQAAQAAKFSVLYGAAYTALFQLSQAFAAIVQQTVAYEDALVDLEFATGRSRTGVVDLADNLAGIASGAGISPVSGVQLGAQAVGLFGVADAGRAVQDQTAQIATRVAAQIAVMTGTPAETVLGQLSSTLASMGLGAEAAPELQDVLTFISRQTGRSMTDLLPALSNVSQLGASAGFTPEELLALISRVTPTAGSPAAAAGNLRQVFSRTEDPSFLRKVQEQFGIDPSGMSLRDIFAAFAATNPSEQDAARFSLLFGRGGSQSAAQILGRDWERIQGLATGAEDVRGTGFGADAAAKALATFGGEARKLGAGLLEVAMQIGNSGAFDSLLLIVNVMNEFVDSLNNLLGLLNEIPRPVRSVGFALAEIALAARLMGGPGALRNLVAPTLGAQAGGAYNITTLPPTTGGRFAAAGSRLRTLGAGALGLVGGPLGAALIGGGILAGNVFEDLRLAESSAQANLNAQRAFAGAGSLEDLVTARAAAREAQRQAAARNEFDFGTLGLRNLIDAGMAGDFDAESENRRLAREAQRQIQQIRRLSRDSVDNPAAAFGTFDSVDTVNAALNTLSERGLTAADRIEALNAAFDAMVDRSTQGRNALATLFEGQGDDFAAAIGRAASQAVPQTLRGFNRRLFRDVAAEDGQQAAQDLLTGFGQARDAFGRVRLGRLGRRASRDAFDVLQARGLDPASGTVQLGEDDIGAVEDAVRQRARRELRDVLGAIEDPKVRRRIFKMYVDNLAAGIRGSLGDFSGQELTAENVGAFLSASVTTAEQVGSERALITGDSLLGAGARLGSLRAARSRVEGALASDTLTGAERQAFYQQLEAFDLQIMMAEDAQVAERIERAQAFAALQASTLGLDDAAGRNRVQLDALSAQLGLTEDPNERARLQAQRNELQQRDRLDRIAGQNAAALAGIDPRDAVGRANQELVNARRDLGALTPGSAQYGQTLEQIRQLQVQAQAAVVARSNAALGAGVAGNDSAIVQARTQVQIARNNLSAQARGTAGYYEALADLRNQQRALAQAELNGANLQGLIEGDLSNPLEAARDEVAAARRRLRRDRRSGQGTDVLAQDEVDLTNARLRRQAEAFNQRFNDAQVAEQLGQMSHAQYLRFLQGERDRLRDRIDGMKKTDDGYRQAVEQLQQVDLAIKGASDAIDGMWNLGDIKVPTPFEVRRFVAGAAGGAAAGNTVVNNTTVQIDGADIATVTNVVMGILGGGAQRRNTTSARKG